MNEIEKAARAIERASNIVICTGAGMGVDSGLPDFRGPEGFWNAYPPYKSLNLRFEELAQPDMFDLDPELAWGFYGHRLNLYRKTSPHVGYDLLKKFIASKESFVVTSNVDGHFMKAGFDPSRIYECHGSINLLQCMYSDDDGNVWSARDTYVHVDRSTMRASGCMPECRTCGGLARPAVLMFMDATWAGAMFTAQLRSYRAWLDRCVGPSVVIELGAGTAIPTIRMIAEALVSTRGFELVRINPVECDVPLGAISIKMGALDALQAIALTLRVF